MNKISILLLTVTIYAVCAEPLRNQQLRQFARQEVTTEHEEITDRYPQSTPLSSGYAPSGWKPSGRLLVLPARQQQHQQYLPPQQYGAPTTPATEYGSPDDVSSTAEASDSSDSNETTDEPESESVNVEDSPSQVQANFNLQPQQQPGYFVQLADGSIQRVLYVTSDNNVVGAKLQVQPQPLYVQPFYVPQTVSFSSQYQSW